MGARHDLIVTMAQRRSQAPKSFGPTQSENKNFELLSSVPDPRQETQRDYPLAEVRFLVITATLSGFNDFTGIGRFGVEKLE